MAAPDITRLDVPLAGYRGQRKYTTGAQDVTFPKPGFVRALTAGTIRYEDSLGEVDDTGNMTAGDDIVGPVDGPIFVRRILAAGTTVTRVQLGII